MCDTSVELLADSEKFPEHWLFKHRWGKGKKKHLSVLPNGEKITFLTVGGRTSAIVPSVQKKTGAVAKDVDGEENSNGAQTQAKRKRTTSKKEESDPEPEDKGKAQKSGAKKHNKGLVKEEDGEDSKQAIETESAGKRHSTRSRK